MILLTAIGLLTMSAIVGFGVWYVVKNITFKNVPERYRYESTKDEHGNETTKVVDLSNFDK